MVFLFADILPSLNRHPVISSRICKRYIVRVNFYYSANCDIVSAFLISGLVYIIQTILIERTDAFTTPILANFVYHIFPASFVKSGSPYVSINKFSHSSAQVVTSSAVRGSYNHEICSILFCELTENRSWPVLPSYS